MELGATRVIGGRAEDAGAEQRATLELVDAVDGRQLDSAVVAIDRRDPAGTQDRLVDAVLSCSGSH